MTLIDKNTLYMISFSNIKELIFAMKREEKLLSEMFIQRKSHSFNYDKAMELVQYDKERIDYLLNRSVIRKNENFLVIDDTFLQFFENILEVNEEINISYVNENLQHIKDNILYFFNERNENRKQSYLRTIKNTFRKVGDITVRNVIDLRRHVETTFKNEPNYKNKKSKLENLDQKRESIINIIQQTEQLIYEDEDTFFRAAVDDELNRLVIKLKLKLSESMHNLIEIEKQIIDYLNQIKYQSGIVKKLRKIKYLRDQFIIEAETDIKQVLDGRSPLIFEPNPSYPLKLSLDYLQSNDDAFESIKFVANKVNTDYKPKPLLADSISDEYLNSNTQDNHLIDLLEIKDHFKASKDDLFTFILSYEFNKSLSFNERVTVFCQLVSQYDVDLNLTDQYNTINDVEYALIYSK